ncbi:MAG TPA: hypothetical protein VE907_11205 [Gammaproteobacteria bacterium]|nr:hypothetical protein [Gammaproteobacteria bacterium]
MRGAPIALGWAIWRRHRGALVGIVVLNVISWLGHLSGAVGPLAGEPAMLDTLFAAISILTVFGALGYVETQEDGNIGTFPRRLFALPVSSFCLVAVPMLAGIACIELLYFAWAERLSHGGSTSPLFIGVLFASSMVFYQTALWTLARLGALRIVVVGVIAVAMFGIGFLPGMVAGEPSFWRTERGLAAIVSALALAAFVHAWRHVARLRSAGGVAPPPFAHLRARLTDALPGRRRGFSSAAAAQFWFEWQRTGMVLPLLVGGVLVLVIGPYSWFLRNDPGYLLPLVFWTLATPVFVAAPWGMAFGQSKPWTEDFSIPSFVATKPLSAQQLVATKIEVAAASAALSWLVVLGFLVVWLLSWADLTPLSRFAIQLWAFQGESVLAVYGIAALTVTVGVFLTFRLLIANLWIGMCSSSLVLVGSAIGLFAAVLTALQLDVYRLPEWLLADPRHVTPLAWGAALCLAAKHWLAARTWRAVAPGFLRSYLLAWGVGTACFVALSLVVWGIVRIYQPIDGRGAQSLAILVALLLMPLARVGLAPSVLAANRHRR